MLVRRRANEECSLNSAEDIKNYYYQIRAEANAALDQLEDQGYKVKTDLLWAGPVRADKSRIRKTYSIEMDSKAVLYEPGKHLGLNGEKPLQFLSFDPYRDSMSKGRE